MAIFESGQFHRARSAVERKRVDKIKSDRRAAQKNPEMEKFHAHTPDYYEARITDFESDGKEFRPIEDELKELEDGEENQKAERQD